MDVTGKERSGVDKEQVKVEVGVGDRVQFRATVLGLPGGSHLGAMVMIGNLRTWIQRRCLPDDIKVHSPVCLRGHVTSMHPIDGLVSVAPDGTCTPAAFDRVGIPASELSPESDEPEPEPITGSGFGSSAARVMRYYVPDMVELNLHYEGRTLVWLGTPDEARRVAAQLITAAHTQQAQACHEYEVERGRFGGKCPNSAGGTHLCYLDADHGDKHQCACGAWWFDGVNAVMTTHPDGPEPAPAPEQTDESLPPVPGPFHRYVKRALARIEAPRRLPVAEVSNLYRELAVALDDELEYAARTARPGNVSPDGRWHYALTVQWPAGGRMLSKVEFCALDVPILVDSKGAYQRAVALVREQVGSLQATITGITVLAVPDVVAAP